MGILSWIVIGLIVGFVVNRSLKTRGFRQLTTYVVSLIGALIGWMNVAYLYGVPGAVSNINWLGMVAALIGSLMLVVLVNLLVPQKRAAV